MRKLKLKVVLNVIVLVSFALAFVHVESGNSAESSTAKSKSSLEDHPATSAGTAADPVYDRRITYTGDIWASVANDGTFGTFHLGLTCSQNDMALLKITECPGFEYPAGSRIDYLWRGSICVGGIVGADTLVSSGMSSEGGSSNSSVNTLEFNGFTLIDSGVPTGYPGVCDLRERRLGQSYTCVYYDTLVHPGAQLDHSGRLHLPLGLQVRQVTHQSANDVTRRFIIYDLEVTNISNQPIEQMWLGIMIDCDVYWGSRSGCSMTGWEDDLTGCLTTWPNSANPRYSDTLMVGWAADDDGDQCSAVDLPPVSPRGVMGVRILRGPNSSSRVNYNWFATEFSNVNWGPRLSTDSRSLGTGGDGAPVGDASRYHLMANGEVDYDQVYSALDHRPTWKPPISEPTASDIANGLDTRFLLSTGPVPVLNPGETVPFTFAFVAGESFHTVRSNQIDPSNPGQYVGRLNFRGLAANAWWADFIWDNHGVDTDGDGYRGKFFQPVINDDTVYYTGDGCPDLSGPSPPPCPDSATADLRLVSSPDQLVVTWSGRTAELNTDNLTGLRDFEGWRVYIADRFASRDRPSSEQYALIAGWDLVDFQRFTYEPADGRWHLDSPPLTTEAWRRKFNNEGFDPTAHKSPSLSTCYRYFSTDTSGAVVEKCAYFAPHGANQENAYSAGGEDAQNLIQRVAVRDSLVDGEVLHYGEYELRLNNLLPSRYYFISVSAVDFGDEFRGLEPQGCQPGRVGSVVIGSPNFSADVVEEYWERGGIAADSVRVIAYPNPYKISFEDAQGARTTYFEQGYEGDFGQEVLREEDRRIHFINVPSDATINIYSLDGDLIRTLNHPDPYLSSYSSEIAWDLVSRNTQAVTSGIYIYRVDSKLGSQVGKLVIIK